MYAHEDDLAGREVELVATLTEAVVAVHGDWARDVAVVQMIGLPTVRWGIGGKPAEAPAPHVTSGIEDVALSTRCRAPDP